MREVERRVVLSVLDRKWREHLYEMDYLQEGIGLRAMAQRDPLVEYQREGFQLFQAMMESIKEESVGYLFNVKVEVDQPAPAPAVAAHERDRHARRLRDRWRRGSPRGRRCSRHPAPRSRRRPRRRRPTATSR